MLFSADKGKNRKNPNNQKDDDLLNNRGKKVCPSNDESET
ncbi:hypothetical protein EHRUM3_11330 [Ehrlichia ruminantium]|nr:hypothetical protein EHRUM3_11330 [Ehrlichia ruminantium]